MDAIVPVPLKNERFGSSKGEQLALFNSHLAGLRIATNTRIAYRYQVKSFLAWFTKTAAAAFPIDLLVSPTVRHQTIMEYINILKEQGAKTNSINSAVTAINAYYRFLDLRKVCDEQEQQCRSDLTL